MGIMQEVLSGGAGIVGVCCATPEQDDGCVRAWIRIGLRASMWHEAGNGLSILQGIASPLNGSNLTLWVVGTCMKAQQQHKPQG